MENEPLDERRELERARYEAIHRKDRLYGASNHGADARNLLLKLKAESILDVGCGDNSFAKWFRSEGVIATGVDFADPRADLVSPAHDLPFPDEHFDWVTSFDVLEHLWPDEVDQVLAEFRRVGRIGLVVSISYQPSLYATKGGNLHRTINPRGWWRSKLAQVLGRVHEYKKYFYGRFRHVHAR